MRGAARLEVAPPCPVELLGSKTTIPLPSRFQQRKASGKIDREQLALYDRFGIEVPLNRFGKPEQRWMRDLQLTGRLRVLGGGSEHVVNGSTGAELAVEAKSLAGGFGQPYEWRKAPNYKAGEL